MSRCPWSALLIWLLAAAFVAIGPRSGHADIVSFTAELTGDQADCANGTCPQAGGIATFVLDTITGLLEYEIDYTVCGNEFVAHVHAAEPCDAGPIIYELPPGNPKIGVQILEPELQLDLFASLHTIIIHTDEFPEGEIRGQLIPDVPAVPFSRGDCDADGSHNLADAIFGLSHLFLGGRPPSCTDACDLGDDGAFGLADMVYLLEFLFAGGSNPLAPYPACALDPTDGDALNCVLYSECP